MKCVLCEFKLAEHILEVVFTDTGEHLEDLFIASRDTDTERVCGTCGILKPVSAFYKDGKNSKGQTRYRRDCRDCYKRARIQEATFKQKKGERAHVQGSNGRTVHK